MSGRSRAQAHAKHGHFCTCGKAVFGNGAGAQHRQMHERNRAEFRYGKPDNHHYVTREEWERVWRRCEATWDRVRCGLKYGHSGNHNALAWALSPPLDRVTCDDDDAPPPPITGEKAPTTDKEGGER